MIGTLQGTVIYREDPQITLVAGDIGYEVHCTLNALTQATKATAPAKLCLWTHLIVRDDALQLYGFADERERALFRELIRIAGVGPKMALAMLSGMDTAGLIAAIQTADTTKLTRLPGIGKKTAERLIVEMRDRLTDRGYAATPTAGPPNTLAAAEQALIGLGYKPSEAARMLSALPAAENMSLEAMIRAALQARLNRP